MEMHVWTLERFCDTCGKRGSVTFEEPERDQSGRYTRIVDAEGCFHVKEGALITMCVTDPNA